MSDTVVLVVDDEPAFREGLRQALTKEGFEVHLAEDGERAVELFDEINPEIVLLDVMLPRMSGLDVCRHIRSKGETPVIMVSARSEEIDAVVALEVGADDYITKPYRLRELIARIRTVLRRSSTVPTPATSPGPETTLSVGGAGGAGEVVLDADRHEVRVDGVPIEMPLKEFQLLATLMANSGFVMTRQDLINRVWGYDYYGDMKTLDVHIKRLRSKIEQDPAHPELIVTIRGLGYKMNR